MGSGNLYVKYSTDGGQTFTTITDLSTVFGDQPDGGYCCDQVLHYIPSIDLIVWVIQTKQKTDSKGNVTGPNSQRVAWAKTADIAANFYTAWTWFDVSSTFLGLGNDWPRLPRPLACPTDSSTSPPTTPEGRSRGGAHFLR